MATRYSIELPPSDDAFLSACATRRKMSVEQLLREMVDESMAQLQLEDADIPGWHKEILDRRIESHRASPENGRSWHEVRASILEEIAGAVGSS